ncbi:urea ABC transporter permease subunit UrtC [Alphaproteobacteria bacterium]|nr:urea ABC transporter permease subunit UrtC [Alphaproteobacteria bacterium]
MITPTQYTDLGRRYRRASPVISMLVVFALLAAFMVYVPLANGSFTGGSGALPDTMVQLFGKILCFALLAVAMDLVWGYCGILSLGHGAFFALGGYAIGMNLIYATADEKLAQITDAVARDEAVKQSIFSVVGQGEDPWPWFWLLADQFWFHALLVLIVPGALAFGFGWLAFRSRVTGVYLSIITQALTLVLGYLFIMNEFGLRGNNGLSGLQNVMGASTTEPSTKALLFIASGVALMVGYAITLFLTQSKFGNVIRGIRDDEDRVRFLGYQVEGYKVFAFVISAMMAGVAGALFAPQAGIINPDSFGPLKSIEIAVWVALGGRGMIYGAIVGAITANLLRSALTGGWINSIGFGAASIDVSGVPWPEFWPIVLGLMFVLVTLFLPRGIMGLWHDIMGMAWQGLVKPRLVAGAGAGGASEHPEQEPPEVSSGREVVASA